MTGADVLQGVNVSRGAFRVWVVLTALWLALVGFLAWEGVSDATRGRYQYAAELKEDVKPWEEYDTKKPISELFKKPSEAKWPASFSKIEYQYQANFDASVKDGSQTVVDFPNGTSLYLYTAFGKPEQEVVSRWFWEKRWQRRLDAMGGQGPLLAFAIVPPLLLLVLWFVCRWVIAGFRRV
ncbi:hypothetical protein Maq22A_c13910 [Methylobacterium aquaticum]|uniref:Uncharacterized protein n=1 Tax=Methylobacterium aquaticum TaxID=270351 RepID=A0A0C6FG22_9HYPH|nr:hypothetical protein Maq22A_c13910 [Methylobacterium aquaticum]